MNLTKIKIMHNICILGLRVLGAGLDLFPPICECCRGVT